MPVRLRPAKRWDQKNVEDDRRGKCHADRRAGVERPTLRGQGVSKLLERDDPEGAERENPKIVDRAFEVVAEDGDRDGAPRRS